MGNSGSMCGYCQSTCAGGSLGSLCTDPVTCICPCNVGSGHDIAQKVAAVAGGALLFAGGTVVAAASGGTLVPMLGGMMASAGMSSAVQGVGKAIGNEKISADEYFTDVGMGFVTGAVGGGADIATGKITQKLTANVAKESYKRGTAKLAFRIAGGAASGTLTTAVGEAGECARGKKKWEDYGRDRTMWAKGAGYGALGGAKSHTVSNFNKWYFYGGSQPGGSGKHHNNQQNKKTGCPSSCPVCFKKK